MRINNKTKLYISAAATPGNFGALVYNKLFEKFGMNCVYIPRAFTDAKKLIEAVKSMDIRGCSISMPLKSVVPKYLDRIDRVVVKTGSVNTVVNNSGRLTGYNTDFYAAQKAMAGTSKMPVIIYGAGSVISSVVFALKKLKFTDITITARDFGKAARTAKKNCVKVSDIKAIRGRGLLINATPASMGSKDSQLFSLLGKASVVFDLVVSPCDTALISEAKKRGIKAICGIEMSKHQLQKQFEIYTGHAPSIAEIDYIIDAGYIQS